MRIGLIGRVWFSVLGARALEIVIQERAAWHLRRTRFHGYTWEQVREVLDLCFLQRRDFQRFMSSLSLEVDAGKVSHDELVQRMRFVFASPPREFRRFFGVWRPRPR